MKVDASALLRGSASTSDAKVLYVGMVQDDIVDVFRDESNEFEIAQSHGTSDTIALANRCDFEYVVVDQSNEKNTLALLITLLAGTGHSFKLIVICQPEYVGKYLRVRGVDRVLACPVPHEQLRSALGFKTKTPDTQRLLPEPESIPAALVPLYFLQLIRNHGVATISTFYKNAAFVLLAVLFSAFCFYGILIGYFLVSTAWGAPVSLSSGHELVVKVEQQINDMRVNANLTSQRVSEAELEAAQATRAHEDAKLLVGYVLGTVEGEIEARTARQNTLGKSVKRISGLKHTFEKQLKSNGMSAELADLFEKHLIDRNTYDSGTLGLLEAGQRLSGLEGDLEVARDNVVSADADIKMLKSLQKQLKGGPMMTIAAASADLILLTKQAVDARSVFDQSKVQLASAQRRLSLLGDSKEILDKRISELLQSPLGRAIKSKVYVIFVPYGNEKSFQVGTPLYSCALTVVICHRAGKVGAAVPGESNAVHPFFGKPIRGFFVEAILDDTGAASQEIIHAGRPPFFF
jgi:hypothetical protein